MAICSRWIVWWWPTWSACVGRREVAASGVEIGPLPLLVRQPREEGVGLPTRAQEFGDDGAKVLLVVARRDGDRLVIVRGEVRRILLDHHDRAPERNHRSRTSGPASRWSSSRRRHRAASSPSRGSAARGRDRACWPCAPSASAAPAARTRVVPSAESPLPQARGSHAPPRPVFIDHERQYNRRFAPYPRKTTNVPGADEPLVLLVGIARLCYISSSRWNDE